MTEACLEDFDQYEIQFLQQEFCDTLGYTRGDFDAAVEGLNTFFCLIRDNPGPLAVTSRSVDNLWHTFILLRLSIGISA
jgi:hypothetical protein